MAANSSPGRAPRTTRSSCCPSRGSGCGSTSSTRPTSTSSKQARRLDARRHGRGDAAWLWGGISWDACWRTPRRTPQYVTILPQLARQVGGEVVEPEAVRTLLDEFGQTYAYGLGPVLALLAPRRHWGANTARCLEQARGVGARRPPRRARRVDRGGPGGYVEFTVESLPAALEEADDFIQYAAGELRDVEHSHALCARLARIVLEASPSSSSWKGSSCSTSPRWERRTSLIGRPRRGSSGRPTENDYQTAADTRRSARPLQGRTRRSIPRRARCAHPRRTARHRASPPRGSTS